MVQIVSGVRRPLGGAREVVLAGPGGGVWGGCGRERGRRAPQGGDRLGGRGGGVGGGGGLKGDGAQARGGTRFPRGRPPPPTPPPGPGPPPPHAHPAPEDRRPKTRRCQQPLDIATAMAVAAVRL